MPGASYMVSSMSSKIARDFIVDAVNRFRDGFQDRIGNNNQFHLGHNTPFIQLFSVPVKRRGISAITGGSERVLPLSCTPSSCSFRVAGKTMRSSEPTALL